MEEKEIINFIEDKVFKEDEKWFFHATRNDVNTISNILNEGIKASYLQNSKGNHFNGKYYISLYKNNEAAKGLCLFLANQPKIIVNGISPLYADRKKYNLRRMFINTKIPLRTSEWDGEFQQYKKIEPSKIVALEYSLVSILSKLDDSNLKEKLIFLRDIILCMQQSNKNLPIYDLSSSKELNKEKILSLNL